MSINECTSLYIPYITTRNPQHVVNVFHQDGIGLVERVDFFENPKATSGWAHSAFVHLHHWYLNEYTDRIYEAINKKDGKWNHTIYDPTIYDPTGKARGYWTLRKMTTPKLPDTIYNIHQLAQRMEEMQCEIHELRALVEGRNNQTITIEDRPNDEPLKLSDLISDGEEDPMVSVNEKDTMRLKEMIASWN
jgi:hypothetical protein